jgi:hypothetical protein
MKFIQLAALSVFLFVIAGCVSVKQYDGPARVRSEIAVLENDQGVFGGMVVTRINGNKLGIGIAEGFELLPGEVTLVVEHTSLDDKGDAITLAFVAQAGETYTIKHLDPPVLNELPLWNAWVEHKSSKREVSTLVEREAPEPFNPGPQQ